VTDTTSPATGSAGADLRAARRDRVFDAMDRSRVDVLVLGRRDDVAYATGARALWTAGTRPFGAACVLVGAHRQTHLLATWDEGVPPEVPFTHLYGLTWNPATMAGAMRAIPGLAEARRLGVDALSPGFARAAARLTADAEVVAADDLVRTVRAVKLPAEIDRITTAVDVCREALDAVGVVLGAGGSLASARAAAVRAAARRGVTVPTSGGAVERVGLDAGASGDERVEGPAPGGSAVRVDVGLLVDGYEGGCGRTVDDGDAAPAPAGTAVDRAWRSLADACRAGASGGDLRGAAGGATAWIVRGSGMGFEEPVVTDDLGADAVLRAGMVLSVEVVVGPWRRRDLVVVGDGPATAL
jgi:Xaa-Pro aminopeptidase